MSTKADPIIAVNVSATAAAAAVTVAPPVELSPATRPNEDVSTTAEAYAVAASLFASGSEPPPDPSSDTQELLTGVARIALRQPTNFQLYFPADTRAEFTAAGYAPWLIEWIGPVLVQDNGGSIYSAVPPADSIFYGKRMPAGMTYYSEFVSILADDLAAAPNGHWVMEPDGSVRRR